MNGTRIPVSGALLYSPSGPAAVDLLRNKAGAVFRRILARGGYTWADGEPQAISRFRQALTTALGGLAPGEFAQAPRPKTLRLSSCSDLVTRDKERPLRHDSERIGRLAGYRPRALPIPKLNPFGRNILVQGKGQNSGQLQEGTLRRLA